MLRHKEPRTLNSSFLLGIRRMKVILLITFFIVVFAFYGQVGAISCHHCKNKKTIADCFKEGKRIECSSKEKACFYQESQPYYRYGQWTVTMGCGNKHMRAGCDERMGTLKCVRWCQFKDNCNKVIAKTTKPLITQSRTSSIHKNNTMESYINLIMFNIMIFLIFEVITYDDIIMRLTYGANLVETICA